MLCSKCHQSADSLLDSGLCADCHAPAEERRLAIIGLAQSRYEQEGSVEIDDNAHLSEGNDNGCYVQAWVWVDFARTRFDKEKEDNKYEYREPREMRTLRRPRLVFLQRRYRRITTLRNPAMRCL